MNAKKMSNLVADSRKVREAKQQALDAFLKDWNTKAGGPPDGTDVTGGNELYKLRLGANIIQQNLRSTFGELAERWKLETMVMSSSHQICGHKAYQKIIELGLDMVPLIFEDILQTGSGHWTYALAAITGIPDEDNPAKCTYNPSAASNAWLQWGKEKGIVEAA